MSKQAFSVKMEAPGSSSFMISSSKFVQYVSSSGKMGFNTTNPKNNFDIKVEELKFRNEDGTKEAEFNGGKFILKKYAETGSRESGDRRSSDAEVSGAEMVFGFSPGAFADEKIARVGDVMGSMTWEDLAVATASVDGEDIRTNATALRIRGVVDQVATDGSSSIQGKLEIGVGSKEPRAGIRTIQSIHETETVYNQNISVSGSNYISIGRHTGDSTTLDRKIVFWNNDTAHKWVTGVDTSRGSYVIHAGNTNFPGANEDFFVKTTGIGTANNLTVALTGSFGEITASGDISSSGIEITGTGSFGEITASGEISSSGAISGSNLSGTNTGDQTTITGNAGTATILATARTIGGVSFNGSAAIVPDTTNCVTDAGNAEHNITYVDGAGTQQHKVDAGLMYNPSTNALTLNGCVITFDAGRKAINFNYTDPDDDRVYKALVGLR